MSTGTIITGQRRVFQRLNEKPLRDDLVFYFAIVAVASVLFMVLPLLTGEAAEIDGLHRIGFIVVGTLIVLVQGLITGAVALLAVSLVEHFFLLFVDVHREFEKTMKSAVYALSPLILFSWAVLLGVPFAGLLLLAWFCLSTYFGVWIFHEKSKDRAVFVALATGAVLAFYLHRWIVGPWLSNGSAPAGTRIRSFTRREGDFKPLSTRTARTPRGVLPRSGRPASG